MGMLCLLRRKNDVTYITSPNGKVSEFKFTAMYDGEFVRVETLSEGVQEIKSLKKNEFHSMLGGKIAWMPARFPTNNKAKFMFDFEPEWHILRGELLEKEQ